MTDSNFDYLIDALKSLPGVGKKQAERIAHFLVKKDERFIQEFVNRIVTAKQKIKICSVCNNYCLGEICDICANPSRDKTKICVVSTQEDLQKIEETNGYTGQYYILNGEINVKSKEYLNQDIVKKFMHLLKQNKVKEVIIATNWTVNGEATAAFIKKIVNQVCDAQVFRIALGLPINSALDYADSLTLKYALKNKTKY